MLRENEPLNMGDTSILESSLNMSTNSRINKNLLKCLVELTGNLLKVHSTTTDCKTENANVTIKHENDSSFNIDIVEHRFKLVNDEQDNLSKNITLLKQHTLELERIYHNEVSNNSLNVSQNTDEFQNFMAGPFKALILQNLSESSVDLTEQICNLINMYKTEENPENTKNIRKCLSKINKKIKSISQCDFEASNDSQTQISDSDLNDYLSGKLKVLIKKVAKLKKVYRKKMRNEATVDVVDTVAHNKKQNNLNNYIHENVQEELSQIINKINTDDSNLDTDDTGVRSPKKHNNFENAKEKRKRSRIVNGAVCAKKAKFVDDDNSMTTNVDPVIEQEIFKKQLKSNKMKQKLLKRKSKETPAESDAEKSQTIQLDSILVKAEPEDNLNDDISNHLLTCPDDGDIRNEDEHDNDEKLNQINTDERNLNTDDTGAKTPEEHKNFERIKMKHKLSNIENDEMCAIKAKTVEDNNSMTMHVEPAIEQEIFKKQLKSNKMKQKLLKRKSQETPVESDADAIIRPEESQTIQLESILVKVEPEDNFTDDISNHFLTCLNDGDIRNEDDQDNVEEELSQTVNTDKSDLDTDDTGVNSSEERKNNFESVQKKSKLSRMDDDKMCAKNGKSVDENSSMMVKVDPTTEQEIFKNQQKGNKKKQKLLKGKSKETPANSDANLRPKKSQTLQIDSIEPLVEQENEHDLNDEDGGISILSEDEENVLENIINNENLTDDEKLMYFRDLLHFAKCETEISYKLEKVLSDLHVVIDWEIPQAHLVECQLTRGPTADELRTLLELGVKFANFSIEEDNIVRQNWNNFYKSHNLDKDPRPFLLLQHGKISAPYKERRKFLQYLGKDLPHRALSTIYRRFRRLFGNLKTGRFTSIEDKIILAIAKTNIRNRFAQLSLLLKRPRKAIQLRYDTIADELHQLPPIRWTLSVQEALLKTIMKLTHTETIEELRDVHVSSAIIALAAKELKIPRVQIREHWNSVLYTRLFIPKRTRLNPFRIKIMNCMIRLEFHYWEQYMWPQVAAEFPGCSTQFIHSLFKTVVHTYVPGHLWSDLKGSLAYLITHWIPAIKSNPNYKTAFIKRLQLNENGNLVEVNK